ncbi:MAG: hypothetical protein AAB316_08955 [Bacteroidota bacterium]
MTRFMFLPEKWQKKGGCLLLRQPLSFTLTNCMKLETDFIAIYTVKRIFVTLVWRGKGFFVSKFKRFFAKGSPNQAVVQKRSEAGRTVG